MASPPELLDELVEEVLLRSLPDDPAVLVRAALVCKRWCRVISSRGFRRRFRELHRAPPVLGFLANINGINCPGLARFVPSSSFRPPRPDLSNLRAIHSCHGRVLLFKMPWRSDPQKNRLLVWDPIADELRELPPLSWCPDPCPEDWNAAVLCASVGGDCDHLDCNRGSFTVVFVGDFWDHLLGCVYTSEDDAWSEPTTLLEPGGHIHFRPKAIVGNALYFMGPQLVEYDLTTREVSLIGLPAKGSKSHIVLMAMEDGRLGFANVHESRLCLWSREVGPDIDAKWEQTRVIELDRLLPVGALLDTPLLTGCADRAGVIFMWTVVGFFSIDLKSGRIKKVGDGQGYGDVVVPFMSFCTPALGAACTGEGFGAGSSSA